MTTVLHVVDRLTGGVPVAVRTYIENSPAEAEHTILAPFEAGSPASAWNGLDVSHIELGRSLFARVSAVRSAATALGPEIIHAHSSYSGAYARVGAPAGTYIAYSPHCFKFDDPALSRARRWAFRRAEKLLARRTDRFVVLSDWEAALARELSGTADIVSVPNTPSLPLLTERRSERSRRTVGMMGRIAPQKDPSYFADFARELQSRDPLCGTTWIGDGDALLRTALIEAGIAVTGWVPTESVGSHLDSLDLYVHTARYEGFPLSVLDAAARRIPVIVRRIPAFNDTPLVTFDAPAQGAEIASRALHDPEFRHQLIERGDQLLRRMNTTTQQRALSAAWSTSKSASTRTGKPTK